MKKNNYTIEAKLSEYIRNECLPKNKEYKLEYDKNLFDDGIIDSAGLITIITYIENEFNIVIPDEDLLPEYFTSLSVIAGYIRAHQKTGKNITTKIANG